MEERESNTTRNLSICQGHWPWQIQLVKVNNSEISRRDNFFCHGRVTVIDLDTKLAFCVTVVSRSMTVTKPWPLVKKIVTVNDRDNSGQNLKKNLLGSMATATAQQYICTCYSNFVPVPNIIYPTQTKYNVNIYSWQYNPNIQSKNNIHDDIIQI